jgi:WbqC-like protein family
MLKPILIEAHYLPSIEYFSAIAKSEYILLEFHEHFVKQSFRNHAFINTANGKEKITVPLTSKGNRTLISDVKIDQSQNWKKNQWRTIESAYRKSPYFEHYADELNKVVFANHIFLVELNLALLTLCFNWLRWEKKITGTQSYEAVSVDNHDLRNVILSKKPYGQRNFFRPIKYTQVFGDTFVDNLSLIDLIFCRGPEAAALVNASCLNQLPI